MTSRSGWTTPGGQAAGDRAGLGRPRCPRHRQRVARAILAFWGVLGGVQDAGDIHGVGSKGGAAFPGLAVWAGALEVVLPPDVHSFVLASGLAR